MIIQNNRYVQRQKITYPHRQPAAECSGELWTHRKNHGTD